MAPCYSCPEPKSRGRALTFTRSMSATDTYPPSPARGPRRAPARAAGWRRCGGSFPRRPFSRFASLDPVMSCCCSVSCKSSVSPQRSRWGITYLEPRPAPSLCIRLEVTPELGALDGAAATALVVEVGLLHFLPSIAVYCRLCSLARGPASADATNAFIGGHSESNASVPAATGVHDRRGCAGSDRLAARRPTREEPMRCRLG